MIRVASHVFGGQAPRHLLVDQRGDRRALPQDLVLELTAIGAADPASDRGVEPSFRQAEKLGRQALPGDLLQQMLAGSTGAFQRLGNPEGELDQSSIEQVAPHFQTVLHAHAIDLHEHVVRKIDLQVRVLRFLDGIERSAAPVWRRHRLEHAARRRVARLR